jgi:hypothetical protein
MRIYDARPWHHILVDVKPDVFWNSGKWRETRLRLTVVTVRIIAGFSRRVDVAIDDSMGFLVGRLGFSFLSGRPSLAFANLRFMV